MFPGGNIVKRYRASGRIPFGGFLKLIVATVAGMLVAGGLAFAVSKFIYLIVLFPFVMGLIGGGALAWAVTSGKVRSPIIAAIFGLLVGAGTIGTYRVLDYYFTFLPDARASIIEEAGEDIPQAELDAFIDEVLESETGSTGFVGYLKFSAQQGTTISRTTSEFTLDETQTWIYWGGELVLVMIVAAGMAVSAARKPFNEEANEWYPFEAPVGSVDWKARKEFYKLLKDGDTTNAFRMVSTAPMDAPRVDLVVQRTPSAPQSDVILGVKEIKLNRRKEISSDKMKGVLSAQEFSTLARLVENQSSVNVAAPRMVESL
jgi:hypothetical protein